MQIGINARMMDPLPTFFSNHSNYHGFLNFYHGSSSINGHIAWTQKERQTASVEENLSFHQQQEEELKCAQHQEIAENMAESSEKRSSESRYWTKDEQQRFNEALKMFGTDYEAIAKHVKTRNSTQVRTHTQKYYAKMVRDYKKHGRSAARRNLMLK